MRYYAWYLIVLHYYFILKQKNNAPFLDVYVMMMCLMGFA